MRLALQLLAPYLSVVLFWCIWPNAWLAILSYHLQILLWRNPALLRLRMPTGSTGFVFAAMSALAGPTLYFLLPHMQRTELASWLASYKLSGISLMLMVPYFGLVHPVLEQSHWHGLRERTRWAHPAFAGYHMIVLSTLLTAPWLLACFLVLVTASLAWTRSGRVTGSLVPSVVSHVLADLGIVLAALAHVRMAAPGVFSWP